MLILILPLLSFNNLLITLIFTNELTRSGAEIGNPVNFISKFCGMFGEEKSRKCSAGYKEILGLFAGFAYLRPSNHALPQIIGNMPCMRYHVRTQQDDTV